MCFDKGVFMYYNPGTVYLNRQGVGSLRCPVFFYALWGWMWLACEKAPMWGKKEKWQVKWSEHGLGEKKRQGSLQTLFWVRPSTHWQFSIKTKSAGSLASFLPHSTWEPLCRLHAGCGTNELKRWSVSFVFATDGGEGMFCRHMKGFFQSFSLGHNRVLKCDVIKMKFLKLWDLSGHFERTMSKRPTCQKWAFEGKLSVRS